MRDAPRVQMSRASAVPAAGKIASPAGTMRHCERQHPAEGLRIDQERVAEPVEPGEQISETEPASR